jgi:hypothetical protein
MNAACKAPTRKREAAKPKRARKPARVTGAVIFLASLLWEDDREADEPLGKLRMEWRKKHLVMDHLADLRVPIRYWRKSGINGRRKGQYTMVFAGKELGTAKVSKLSAVLPVRAGVIPAKTETQIAREADALARAEDIQKNGDPRHVCTWGVVAMAINPNSPHRAELRRVWRRIFKRDPNKEHWRFGPDVVDRSGFLRVKLRWSDEALRVPDLIDRACPCRMCPINSLRKP